MSYIKTTYSGIVKDMNTHAVINTDDSEFQRILEKRKQFKQSQAIQVEIESLKSEFLELKNMLKQVLSGRA